MAKRKTKKSKKSKRSRKEGTPGPFKKGFDPGRNLNGRPKGSRNKYSIVELMEAIKEVEKTKRKPLLKAFVERAYKNDAIMVALMKKLLPDLKSVEAITASFESAMDDEIAKMIQDKLRERYASAETEKKSTKPRAS